MRSAYRTGSHSVGIDSVSIMADKPDKKPEAAAPAAGHGADKKEAAKGGGLMSKTPVMLGGVMLIEAVVLFAGFKFLGGSPKPADAAEAVVDEHGKPLAPKTDDHAKKKVVEVPVLDFRATNKVSGRTFLFDVSIYARVPGDKEEEVKGKIKSHEALIKDRLGTIIRQSDPEKLGGSAEPGLETLRRQVKYQLDEIIGESMVEEVLVPRCIPFRADL